jgi:hypothetical protein
VVLQQWRHQQVVCARLVPGLRDHLGSPSGCARSPASDCLLGVAIGVSVCACLQQVSSCVVLISTWPRDPQGSPSNTPGWKVVAAVMSRVWPSRGFTQCSFVAVTNTHPVPGLRLFMYGTSSCMVQGHVWYKVMYGTRSCMVQGDAICQGMRTDQSNCFSTREVDPRSCLVCDGFPASQISNHSFADIHTASASTVYHQSDHVVLSISHCQGPDAVGKCKEAVLNTLLVTVTGYSRAHTAMSPFRCGRWMICA